jgi:hypothetical protein
LLATAGVIFLIQVYAAGWLKSIAAIDCSSDSVISGIKVGTLFWIASFS